MRISTVIGFMASASIPAMVAAAAITTPVSDVVSVAAQKWTNFSSTCNGIQLIGNSILRANCDAQNATTIMNELDLDQCIACPTIPADNTPVMIDLAFQPDGNFSQHCYQCDIQSGDLKCSRCVYRNGSDVTFAEGLVTLDVGIGNNGGFLTCDGGVGVLVPTDQYAPVLRDVDAVLDSVWFSHNCKKYSLVGSMNSTLRATCSVLDMGYGGVTTGYLTTELDLNLCIGMNQTNEVMEFQVYGKLINYCDQLWIGKDLEAFVPSDSPFLHGYCYPNGDHSDLDGRREGNLNLDAGIGASNDGYLTCRGGQGTVVNDDQRPNSYN